MKRTRNVKGYQVSTNPFNGGIQCTFKHNGKWFWADLCHLWSLDTHITECMVFNSDENGNVNDWMKLYCKRCVEFSDESLVECIEEFKNSVE